MLPPFVRKYLMFGLAGTPEVLEGLLHDTPSDSAFWDFRPDPERFTPREVLAHLADWEDVFYERMFRICAEDLPTLPDKDEGQIAIDNDYARKDPRLSLRQLRDRRVRMVSFLRNVEAEEWKREGSYLPENPMMSGPTPLYGWLAQVLGHDGYHTAQIAQYLTLYREAGA